MQQCTCTNSQDTLSSMAPGERGSVCHLDTSTNQQSAQRLTDLGFLPGTPIEVVRRAPFGSHVVVEIRDYVMSLRKSEAERIFITATV